MTTIKKLGSRKRIAMVAHDNRKADLMEWAVHNKTVLAKHELFATGTTGRLLEEALDRPVKKLLSGPLGGFSCVALLYVQNLKQQSAVSYQY